MPPTRQECEREILEKSWLTNRRLGDREMTTVGDVYRLGRSLGSGNQGIVRRATRKDGTGTAVWSRSPGKLSKDLDPATWRSILRQANIDPKER